MWVWQSTNPGVTRWAVGVDRPGFAVAAEQVGTRADLDHAPIAKHHRAARVAHDALTARVGRDDLEVLWRIRYAVRPATALS
jgi:hypothetical protein